MHKNYREGPSYDQRDPKRQKSEHGKSMQQYFPPGEIKLTANFFRLSFNVNSIYQYHVEFQPEIDSRAMRRAMFYQHLDKTGPQFLVGEVLFLQRDSKDLKFESIDREGRKYSISIKKTKEIIPSEHNNAEELRHIFNNILKEVFRTTGLADLGRRGFLYDLQKKKELSGYGLNVMLGYSTAVQTLKGGIFLNISAVSKIIRNDTALDLAKNSPNLLRGRFVITRYTNKTYRVHSVDSTKSPMSTFPVRVTRTENGQKIKEERQTSFLDYYYQKYKLQVTDKHQPLLEVIQKRNGVESTIFLIPELVSLTGLEDRERSDFTLKIALSKITIKPADERMQSINGFAKQYVTSLKQTKKGETPSWNIRTVNEPVSFRGRKIENEVVLFRDQKFEGKIPDWKNLYTAKYFSAPALRNWRLFYLSDEREDKRNFLEVFRRTLDGYGIEVDRPTEHEVQHVRDFESSIDRHITPDDNFVMVMLPKRMEKEYQAVKALLCGSKPIPSQIVCTATFRGKGPQAVCNKLAAQITGKLGGIPWQVDVSKFAENPIMVCGLTTGPTAKGGTVVTLTASYTRDMAQYMSFSEFQDSKEITCLEKLLLRAGEQFKEKTDHFPRGLIVFREGVGEGSLDKLIQEELKQVQAVAQKEEVIYVIVNKKTNTRFFVDQGGKYDNPPSGTVVDDVIVRNPGKYGEFSVFDFYLVAQTSNQGTVSPSHYIVFNKSHFDARDVENLAYKLTHTYYNWTGTVAVPSPLMNARKLAQLLSQKTFVPNQQLSGTLYFL